MSGVKQPFQPLFLDSTFAKNLKIWILLHSPISLLPFVKRRNRTASLRLPWGSCCRKTWTQMEQTNDTATLQLIVQRKDLIIAIGCVLKSISFGSTDWNNVYLNIESINTTND